MPVIRPLRPLAFALALVAGPLAASAQQGAAPAPGSVIRVPSAERPFAVERHGRGRPVILIPGLMSSGRVWDETVRRYARGHEVHVLTLAGFAGVPPVALPRFLDGQRDAIIRYVREQRLERPVVVGHSLGGFLAFAVAAAAPDLVGPVVAVDGVPFLTTLGDTTLTPERIRPQAEAARAVYAGLTPAQLELQSRAATIAMVQDTAHVSLVASWSRQSDPSTVGQAIAEMMTTDLRETVSAIRTPVVLVAAAGGATTPEQRERVRAAYARQVARIPGARVVVAERARHFVMLDDPAFLHALLDEVLAGQATAARAEGGR